MDYSSEERGGYVSVTQDNGVVPGGVDRAKEGVLERKLTNFVRFSPPRRSEKISPRPLETGRVSESPSN